MEGVKIVRFTEVTEMLYGLAMDACCTMYGSEGFSSMKTNSLPNDGRNKSGSGFKYVNQA